MMVVKIARGTLKRMFNEFHPDWRIASDALARLETVVSDFTRLTLDDACKIAENSKRKTVMEKDIILASS